MTIEATIHRKMKNHLLLKNTLLQRRGEGNLPLYFRKLKNVIQSKEKLYKTTT